MWVVIFRARVRVSDAEYERVARRLRQLALEEFGCLRFIAATDDDGEVAISYWPTQESIGAWRRHAEHVVAQETGRERWYDAYDVDVARVERSYAWRREEGP